MYRIETDRHPGRRIWFGALEDTVAGLEVTGRVRMKPRMLRLAADHWMRVDTEEILYLEADEQGRTTWVTLRGEFQDLDSPNFEAALTKAGKSGVFVQISDRHAVAPGRIIGVRLRRRGDHILEVEGLQGVVELPLTPRRLQSLEECLEAINLGGGFLVSEPEEM